MIKVHLGLDDTDSMRTGCTTYIGALLVEDLLKMGCKFIDYPNLIRLNPNTPWKTRGNGAICLRIRCEENKIPDIIDISTKRIEQFSDFESENTNPGLAVLRGNVPKELEKFAQKALWSIVKYSTALKLAKRFNIEVLGFKNGRGIIGALAAIGNQLKEDYTYELLAYRIKENLGKPRKIDKKSVIEMDKATKPFTFNNIDPETGRILITPRGADPVLYGIRGESPEVVKKAHEMIKVFEEVDRWVIYRSNQGTDAHLRFRFKISELKPFMQVIVRGVVSKSPEIIVGRHVIFSIRDETGEVNCAAYEPTGELRNTAKLLEVGDEIEVYGAVRPPSNEHPMIINMEKMQIIKLAKKITYMNPVCMKCGKRMKSMGSNKGFKCPKCGFKNPKATKLAFEIQRKLKPGLYITSPRSQRHLTKPKCRYGLEKSSPPTSMIDYWCSFLHIRR